MDYDANEDADWLSPLPVSTLCYRSASALFGHCRYIFIYINLHNVPGLVRYFINVSLECHCVCTVAAP